MAGRASSTLHNHVGISPLRAPDALAASAAHARPVPGGAPDVGLLTAIGCLWFFGALAESVITKDSIVRLDQAVAAILRYLATPDVTTFFLAVTALGSGEVLVVLGLVVTAVYGLRRRWLYVGTWLAALTGGVLLNRLLKELFARSRPSFLDPLLVETGYSFPSGHAMLSLTAYGMLAYFAVLGLRTRRASTAAISGTLLLVLLIGFSRMYLGVHYFSDVVAGYTAGGVWLSTLITGTETIRRRGLRRSTKPRLKEC